MCEAINENKRAELISTLVENLPVFRAKLGATQDTFAQRVGLTKTTLNHIENYKKVDKEGFDKINGLKYKTGENEYVSYDIEIFIDNNLTEWGGAKSSLRKNKDGVYSGGISIESGFSETDNHLAHEFGHIYDLNYDRLVAKSFNRYFYIWNI